MFTDPGFGADENLVQGNVINLNDAAGVAVSAGTGNAILTNSMLENGGIDLDLDNNEPTVNDPGDADIGSNNLQNSPELAEATVGGGVLTIS